MSDTITLLRILDSIPNQTLSRGEIRRRGINDATINEATDLNQITITLPGDMESTRNGELSSIALISLTDIGETALDESD